MAYRLNDLDGCRTDAEGKSSIKERTIRECRCQPIMKVHLESFGCTEVSVGDYGIDNYGEYIENDRLVTRKPDWKISLRNKNGVQKCEIVEVMVHSATSNLVSCKINKIKYLIDHENSLYIVQENGYYAIGRDGLIYLRDKGPRERGWGGHVLVRYNERERFHQLSEEKIIRFVRWSPSAYKLMQRLDDEDYIFEKKWGVFKY